ncbi:MAG: 3-methyl-2-oxobutanoate hydroxymethyltransferase [Deltaproteobacteria bacterium]
MGEEKLPQRRRVTFDSLRQKKAAGERIVMLTAYDWGMATIIDQAPVDMVLVGDSLGMVALGYPSTIPVTVEEMLHHSKAVRRGVKNALLVGDMPYLSYQISEEEAVRNAGRFLKEAGCDAVKIEGGSRIASTVARIVSAGIPVMGHIGLTPQTASSLGQGFKVRGRDIESARSLVEDAKALVEAGIFSLVLECIPSALAGAITERVPVPTIGIGAGPRCDGQVLVTNDLLGMFEKFTPRFVKQYARLAPVIREALAEFAREVTVGAFPGPENEFSGGEEVVREIFS